MIPIGIVDGRHYAMRADYYGVTGRFDIVAFEDGEPFRIGSVLESSHDFMIACGRYGYGRVADDLIDAIRICAEDGLVCQHDAGGFVGRTFAGDLWRCEFCGALYSRPCDCGHDEGNYPCEFGTAGEGCGF